MSDSIEASLVDHLVRLKVCPFIGSGLSRSVELPSYERIISLMTGEIGAESGESYPDTAQRYEDARGRDALIALLREQLAIHAINFEKLDVHHALFDFPFLDLFTTNQDIVIEAALANLHVPHFPVRSHEDLQRAKPLLPRRVIKFHGDIESPHEIVFTRRDYERRLSAPTWLDLYLQGRLIENAVLFMGYSLGDENVRLVWERMRKHAAPASPPIAFRLLIRRDDAEEARMAALGIQCVTVPVSDPENPVELLDWLHRIRSRATRFAMQTSMDYLMHGQILPARTLTRGQFEVARHRVNAGEKVDDVIREVIFHQRIPLTLKHAVEGFLIDVLAQCDDLATLWRIAVEEQFEALAMSVLNHMDVRQPGESDRSEDLPLSTAIARHLDSWSLTQILEHLDRVSPAKTARDPKHHVVLLFDALHFAGVDDELDADVRARFEETLKHYGDQFPVIRARWELPSLTRARDIEKRMSDAMERARTRVS